jgi:hypothetical protein
MTFFAVCATGLSLPLAAMGNTYTLSSGGSMDLQASLQTALIGSLIGDWDEIENPEGTRTIPGLWGGSGNNFIPLELTLTIALGGNSDPTGPLEFTVDSKTSSATIDGLAWNVLPNATMSATLTGTVLYETFRTVLPSSLYPGGIPVDIPLGNASVTAATLTQIGPAIGTATPIDGQPGAFDVLIPVPATLSLLIVGDILGELPMEFPIVLTLQGIHQPGSATDVLTMTAEAAFDEGGDLPGEPLPTIPIEMPTVLPPGVDTAGLLLDLTPASFTALFALTADLVATHPHGIPADVNNDGQVNTDDLLAVLAVWGPCSPPCPEDINGDGLVDVNDILILIGAWSA